MTFQVFFAKKVTVYTYFNVFSWDLDTMWEYINVCGYSDQFCKNYRIHTYTYYIHILHTESVIT